MRITNLIFLFPIILYGCGKSHDNISGQVLSDTVMSHYNPLEYNLDYEIPFPHYSIVARRDNLPENVSMCIVDTMTNVSILLFKLHSTPKDTEAATRLVKLITKQNNGEFEIQSSYQITKSRFLNTCAWNFRVSLNLSDQTNTIPVTFYGYIFNNLALVATAYSDTASADYFAPYINGLKTR